MDNEEWLGIPNEVKIHLFHDICLEKIVWKVPVATIKQWFQDRKRRKRRSKRQRNAKVIYSFLEYNKKVKVSRDLRKVVYELIYFWVMKKDWKSIAKATHSLGELEIMVQYEIIRALESVTSLEGVLIS